MTLFTQTMHSNQSPIGVLIYPNLAFSIRAPIGFTFYPTFNNRFNSFQFSAYPVLYCLQQTLHDLIYPNYAFQSITNRSLDLPNLAFSIRDPTGFTFYSTFNNRFSGFQFSANPVLYSLKQTLYDSIYPNYVLPSIHT